MVQPAGAASEPPGRSGAPAPSPAPNTQMTERRPTKPTSRFHAFRRDAASWLVTNVTVTLFWLFFRLLSRTTVIGRKNVGVERNTLLLSNHQSMIDSFPVGLFAFYPRSWLKPHLLPWNPAAAENFYRSRVLAWLADRWRCIPVKEGRRDLRALHRMIQVLPHGVMTLFPEAGRTRTGDVGAGRAGAGMVILKARPKVIPVAIDGMQDVLPVGRRVPRLFQRVVFCYGPPIDFGDLLDQPASTEVAQAITGRAMEAIRAQQAQIKKHRQCS